MKLSEFSLRHELDETVERDGLEAILRRVNQSAVPYPGNKTVPALFIEQALKTPDAVAVIYGDSRLSYGEVDRCSSQLARFLSDQGLKPEDVVGTMLDGSPGAIVAMLGSLKAACAYLPLTPGLPPDRLRHMLRDSRAAVLIAERSQSETCHRLQADCPDLKHLLWVNEKKSEGSPGLAVEFEYEGTALDTYAEAESFDRSRPNTLAYVMYTSGSTGQPKGVMIEHQAIVRLVRNTNYLTVGPQDCIAQAANVAFDAATFEVWGALLNGASTYLVSREELLDPQGFAGLLRGGRFNILFLTTALFNRFAQLDARIFESLKYLLFGGEAVDVRWVAAVVEGGGRPQHLLHVYGPTESTTFATWYEVKEVAERATTVPIGGPLANTTVYLLDEKLEPVDIGEAGELYLGGDGLARGYLNDPALTAEKFVTHPQAAKERLYRTGDLARWRDDGQIEFLGRIDDQVKIRGFRVEPAEIEIRLLQNEQLREAIVLVKTDEGGDRHLAAYFTARGQVEVGALRDSLAEILPDYMIPGFFVQLEALPLTPNGKVDRKALPDPKRALPAAPEAQDQPAIETEKALLDIWREVLGQPGIGVNDNFFEHGGHSINAVKLMHLIHKKIGCSLPFTLVFKAPTVRALTECILDAAKFGHAEIDEPLVPLSADQDGPAIFGFPPGTGDALSYTKLAECLKPCTFHAFNFIADETRFADYADLITGVRPAGPYLLFGYSGGGNLAFRTAKELEDRGHKVSDVVMLDSSRFLQRFLFPAEEPRRLAADFLEEEGVKGYITSQVLRDKALRIIERYYDVFSSLQENDIINANIHVVLSEGSPDSYYDESGSLICSKSGWAKLTRNKFKTYQGHGDHRYMLNHQHIRHNAALLREIFHSASAAAGPAV